MSSKGERYIRDRLAQEPPEGMEPSLNRAFRSTVHDRDGRLIERCDREHYFFGYSPPSKHTDHTRLQLFGRIVAMHRNTLETLRDKQLTVAQSDAIDGVDQTREVLVAIASDATTKKT